MDGVVFRGWGERGREEGEEGCCADGVEEDVDVVDAGGELF